MGKILLVDDDAAVLQSMRILLSSEGHQVVMEQHALDALKRLESEDVDILITDIRMAPLDGMDLMDRVHAIKPDLPVIVVSAYTSDQAVAEGFEHGCFAYLTKPFHVRDVIEAVNKALAGPGGAAKTKA